jgi:integrase
MALHQLDNAFIERARAGRINRLGRHSDGGGLYLKIGKVGPIGSRANGHGRGSASWVFRYALGGQRTYLGGGSLADVGLGEARRWAERQRVILAGGGDPKSEREDEVARLKAERAATVTFKDEAERVVAGRKAGSAKHDKQWGATLQSYAYPVIGGRSVATLKRADVLEVLEPIWKTKYATAQRVRQRIEAVIEAAIARGLRDEEKGNPARWVGLKAVLGSERPTEIEHHAAMPWQRVPTFLKRLRKAAGISARALELTVLTACRTNEVLGARWEEFDVKRGVWMIPPERMKAKREHRVPLAKAALGLLHSIEASRQRGPFVFPAISKEGRPLSNMAMLMTLRRLKLDAITVHGFRSSFRDWCADHAHPREVAEAALAHTVQGVEGSYFRSDIFERRRTLMSAWAAFCDGTR